MSCSIYGVNSLKFRGWIGNDNNWNFNYYLLHNILWITIVIIWILNAIRDLIWHTIAGNIYILFKQWICTANINKIECYIYYNFLLCIMYILLLITIDQLYLDLLNSGFGNNDVSAFMPSRSYFVNDTRMFLISVKIT